MLIPTISFVLIILLIYFIWSRRKLYALAFTLEGPRSLPILGSAYLFMGSTEDYLSISYKLIKKFKNPMKFWLGPDLLIVFKDPKHVEKILTSNKITHKHDVYKLLKPYGGEGLITASGPKWKTARKLIQPLYNAKFVASSLNIIEKHVKFAIGKMKEHLNGERFCIEKIIHDCVSDIIGEVVLGTKVDFQLGKNRDLHEAMKGLYKTCFPRILKPWLHPNFIYNLTSRKRRQTWELNILSNFFNKVLQLRQECTLKNGFMDITKENNGFIPSLIEVTKAFHNTSFNFSEQDLKDNLYTLFAASEDTIALVTASACVCFGMYPECQERAFEEIRTVLSSVEKITCDDLMKLTYLDMCIKEVLRLFPIAPFILRKTTEDFKIDKWTIPSGCAVLIPIFNLHLNSLYWKKPMEFYPEHFLPEAVDKRPTYSYIPFSAGPRGCIGKLFAQNSLKLLIAMILQHYVIKADGKYADIFKKLRADISVRSKCGYRVSIENRIKL